MSDGTLEHGLCDGPFLGITLECLQLFVCGLVRLVDGHLGASDVQQLQLQWAELQIVLQDEGGVSELGVVML